jgi:hypothetical protein
MPYESILQEVHQLNDISERLKLLSAEHPLVEEALMTVCGNIRNTATLLEVLVAIKTINPEQSDAKINLLTLAVAELDQSGRVA